MNREELTKFLMDVSQEIKDLVSSGPSLCTYRLNCDDEDRFLNFGKCEDPDRDVKYRWFSGCKTFQQKLAEEVKQKVKVEGVDTTRITISAILSLDAQKCSLGCYEKGKDVCEDSLIIPERIVYCDPYLDYWTKRIEEGVRGVRSKKILGELQEMITPRLPSGLELELKQITDWGNEKIVYWSSRYYPNGKREVYRKVNGAMLLDFFVVYIGDERVPGKCRSLSSFLALRKWSLRLGERLANKYFEGTPEEEIKEEFRKRVYDYACTRFKGK